MNDKWVRKAIFDRINNITVNTETIPCYDIRATDYEGNFYTILSTQNKTDAPNKCGGGWNYFILIDIFTRYRKNTGSRMMADDIEEEIITQLDGIQLDAGANRKINRVRITSEPDITDVTRSEIVHRKFLRYEFGIQ